MSLFPTVQSLIFTVLVVQPGELPVPRKSKQNQIWGNFTLMDFLEANWIYLASIVFIIALLIFYNFSKKAEEKKKNSKNP